MSDVASPSLDLALDWKAYVANMSDQFLDRHQIYDLDVDGMTCGSCAARIQKTLAKQPGVTHADVNFATGRARVSVDDTFDLLAAQSAVERTGYAFHAPEPLQSAAWQFVVGGMTCGSCGYSKCG